MFRTAQDVKVRPGAQKSGSTSLPAPIGGLNARDSIANMPTEDATIMENWFPGTTSVDVRNGYSGWNTFTGQQQAVLIYTGLTATKVFACVKNASTYSIYDATSSGALSMAVVGGAGATIEALTSCRFDSVQYSTAAGAFMSVVNGSDTALEYNGSAWSVATLTHASLSSTNKLFSVQTFAERMWFAEKDSFNVYYLPVRTKSGAMERINLGSWFKLGGYINSIMSITDESQGIEDYIVFLSSEGEAIAYTGNDPGDAATWSQVGHIRIGRPVIKGNRTWCKLGVDAMVLCADGVYPLRKAFNAQTQDTGLAVSDKIRPLLNTDILTYGAKYGWTVIVHPSGNKLFVNVPTAEDSASYQYVMNTQTGAWCKYTGWTAFCFGVAGTTLYWGGNGVMVKADVTANDGTLSIASECRQAFTYIGRRGIAKHMKMLRPIIGTDGEISLSVTVNVDYENVEPTYLEPIPGGAGDPWGTGVWDVAWSGGVVLQSRWFGVVGIGHAVAVRMKSLTDGNVLYWSATDMLYEYGGVLA